MTNNDKAYIDSKITEVLSAFKEHEKRDHIAFEHIFRAIEESKNKACEGGECLSEVLQLVKTIHDRSNNGE